MPGLPGTQTGRGLNSAGIIGFHNVLDEGLRGDGLGSDGTALTALFTALPSAGGVVVLPPATYNLDSSPSVPNNVTLIICAGVTLTGAGALSAAAGGAILDFRNRLTVTGGLTLAAGTNLTSDSGTVAAVAGAATLNKQSGTITTEALTTAAAADYTLTLTNSVIAATSRVLVSLDNGTNTTAPVYVRLVTPAAGSVVIIIRNAHASSALNGTLKVNFLAVS